MKKSTLKLILFTFIGVVISFILYNIEANIQPGTMFSRAEGVIEYGIYIAPFIGLLYWLFCRQLDE